MEDGRTFQSITVARKKLDLLISIPEKGTQKARWAVSYPFLVRLIRSDVGNVASSFNQPTFFPLLLQGFPHQLLENVIQPSG